MAIEHRVGPLGRAGQDAEVRRAIEGEERVALLPEAELVGVAPGEDDGPPFVVIRWTLDSTERPYPGTAIWRAALERYLEGPVQDASAEWVVRPLIATGLERFPSLEAWLRWQDHERRRRQEAGHTAGAPARPALGGFGWSW